MKTAIEEYLDEYNQALQIDPTGRSGEIHGLAEHFRPGLFKSSWVVDRQIAKRVRSSSKEDVDS